MPSPEQRAYYAHRAATARNRARAATDPDIRKILEDMAASYDKLVEEADRLKELKRRLGKA